MSKTKKFFSYFIFYLIQFTWGILHNLVGIGLAIWMLATGHKPHRCGPYIYFIEPKLGGGIEGGIFYFVYSENTHISLHEMGHGIQNMCWGPLFIFVIFIPSCVRFWWREWYWKYRYVKTGKALPSYDSIWFEGQATKWGAKYWASYWAKRNN